MQNRTFIFFVGSGLWTQPHEWLILAHSSHPSIVGFMLTAEMPLLAWGLLGREGVLLWIYLDLVRFRRIWSQDVCRPVAPCGTGVVGPKEILLQSQTAVSEAWSPVGSRLRGWD